MLTPVELQNIPLKSGMGYKKKEVDDLLDEVCKDYEQLYKENLELKDKLSVLSDGLQYYKEMEKTLQKTLVVAEKTAEEMQNTSKAKASLIEEKAKAEAAYIIEDAKKQAQQIHNQTLSLAQQYENYRIQYKRLAASQVELLESDAYQLHFNTETPEFLIGQPEDAAREAAQDSHEITESENENREEQAEISQSWEAETETEMQTESEWDTVPKAEKPEEEKTLFSQEQSFETKGFSESEPSEISVSKSDSMSGNSIESSFLENSSPESSSWDDSFEFFENEED